MALVLLAALLAAGCDTINYAQFVVAKVSPADQVIIKQTVESSAAAAGLADRTETSKVPDTLAFYLEPVPHFPVSLGARMVGDSAVVDLSCFHPGVDKPLAFRSAETNLTTTLYREFGTRLAMPDYQHRVPLKQ